MTKFNSYAQYGEDSILLDFFGINYKGLIVDVGALDGYHLSNSFLLSQLGWKSILVEAHPVIGGVCAKNRQESVVIQKACGNLNGTTRMHLADRGSHSHISDNGTEIECETLDSILENNINSEIDILSIDVDGSEKFVFEKFSIKRWKPRIMILETSEVPEIIERFIKESGYNYAIRVGINDFVTRDKNDALKLQKIFEKCKNVKGKMLTETFNHFDTEHIIDVGDKRYYELVNEQKEFIGKIKQNLA